MCAYNQGNTIREAIRHICRQNYLGYIRLLLIDNCSTDNTEQVTKEESEEYGNRISIEYIYCDKPGKSNALNCGLALVDTKYFITVDGDTFLEENAVQNIMNHIAGSQSICVAGNLFVHNSNKSIAAKMQIYDYLLSIAAVKRFQSSYKSTLVAQGAFSAFETEPVKTLGGWKDCLGEDIVLTYQLLEKGFESTYEPTAVGYTEVPDKLSCLYNQRKRWAIGMLEGFSYVKPWKQGSGYAKFFTGVNISIIYLDLAYIFGFLPAVIWAFLGYYYFVGCLTLLAVLFSLIGFCSMYVYQKKLKIPFKNSFVGFIFFLLFFQFLQSMASLEGYFKKLFNRKARW
jgi:biofilm PGA synthesis N-glycosyltransferase PgaC